MMLIQTLISLDVFMVVWEGYSFSFESHDMYELFIAADCTSVA